MKKFQLEVWNTFDKLCLMSAVTKLKTSFTDQNWVAISRYTKQLHETISAYIQYDSRSDEWFSAKQCSAQYELLIKGSGARKKKKIDRSIDYSDVHDALLASLTQEFCSELEESLNDARVEYLSSKQIIEDLDTDSIDDEKLEELVKDMLEVEKGPDIKTKLKCMLDEKSANDTESTTKYAPKNLLSTEPSTSGEHKATNITTSPLLTSLLQSPSPLVRSTPSTSSPTISLLLHSSPSVSLTDPTLSKLLESPTSLPGSSTTTSIESSPYIFQGTMVDSQQISSETKKKQSDHGEEIPVQRIINDPEEYQRTEGFDDMSDIEQGVVESEVIIENESSPVKRLTPRRLDLENIEEEEPEEEIVETVEEIMERVEEAIIETVGENINELVLNETADSVSISDVEMENINVEDNTYEVIVVGTQEEAVPSSNEVSDNCVIFKESNTKPDKDKIKDMETNDAGKKSETPAIDDQMRNSDASSGPIHHQNVDAVCNEVSLMKYSKDSDEDSINYNKERSESSINKVSEESSNNGIIQEEKSVPHTVISINKNSSQKQQEDDESRDMDGGQIAQVVSLTDESNSVPHDHSISPTSDSNEHSIVENLDEAISNEKADGINQCPQNLRVNPPDKKYNERTEKRLGEETQLVVKESVVEVKSPDKVDKVIEEQIDITDNPNEILEVNQEFATNDPKSLLEDKVVEEQLELNNEEALNEGENIEGGSSSDEIFVIDSQPSNEELLKEIRNSDGVSRNGETISVDFQQSNNEEVIQEINNSEGGSRNGELISIDSQQSNNEETSISDDIIFIDSQQSNNEEILRDSQSTEGVSINADIIYVSSQQSNAAVSISSDEIVVMSISSDERESPEKVTNRQRKNQSENDKSVESPESMDHVVIIDSDSGSSEELVINSNEIRGTVPISNSNISEEKSNGMEKNNNKHKEKNTGTEETVEDIENSEHEEEQTNDDELENISQNPMIIDEENRLKSVEIEKNISSIGIMEENHEDRETNGAQVTPETIETSKAQGTQETHGSLETNERQESQEAEEIQESHGSQETNELQESHDGSYDGTSGPIYIESDESKSDSTEETEDNSILTTEDSKDGLDDSLKFSSLETLSMPSVDSPPECTDPRFAGLASKEKEFRSLIGKGFEELKSKAAELVYIPDNGYEEKSVSGKQGKTRSKSRTKKDKSFKSKNVTEKANREKSIGNKQSKEKSSKDRAGKDKLNYDKPSTSGISGRKSKFSSSFDSKPGSPSLSTASSDEDRDYKSWKKSILLVYNRLASHKYASVFSKPITDNEAPSYHQLILRPMDLSTIKRNIENGVIRTTVEFQRDMLLMVQNAIIYNKFDTPVYDMAKAMGEDMLAQMEVMVQALGDGVPLIGDTSEEKQITRARTSKSSTETPQSKKRKTQEPDEIRPKRSKPSSSC